MRSRLHYVNFRAAFVRVKSGIEMVPVPRHLTAQDFVSLRFLVTSMLGTILGNTVCAMRIKLRQCQ